jgi:murein DD-endopeptidase MepM/ murein hydrolase activator NlpD
MDDATFEEKIVFRLKPLSIFVVVVISALILIGLSISFIAFTSLREYIPGYGSSKQNQKIMQLHARTDSLEQLIGNIEVYEKSIKMIMLGIDENAESDTVFLEEKKENADFAMTYYDSILLQINDIELPAGKTPQVQMLKRSTEALSYLYTPIRGTVEQKFSEKHAGVSLLCKRGTSIYACATGTVVHVGHDAQYGTTLIINHPNNVMAVYRQAGTPMVNIGDIVKQKQMIAITDFDGVVYFGLWIDGIAVNPENYMLF